MISGVIANCEPLRYTPAGIALLHFVLDHESSQENDGQPFVTRLSLPVTVAGRMALEMESLSPGTAVMLKGFLAPRSRSSNQVVMRAEQFKLLTGESNVSSST